MSCVYVRLFQLRWRHTDSHVKKKSDGGHALSRRCSGQQMDKEEGRAFLVGEGGS